MINALLLSLLSAASPRYQGDDCKLETRFLRQFRLPIGDYELFKLSSDGRKFAAIDRPFYTLEIWDLVSQVKLVTHNLSYHYKYLRLSPSFNYGAYDDVMFNWQTGLQIPIPYSAYVAWSPDEKTMVVGVQQSSVLEIRDSTSGVTLAKWALPIAVLYDVCWSPGPLISVSAQINSSYVLLQYHPNGTLLSRLKLPGSWIELGCNQESAVVSYEQYSRSMNTADLVGNTFSRQFGINSLPDYRWGGIFLGVCPKLGSGACQVYDITLQPVLTLPETIQHRLVGLFHDGSQLVTYYGGSLYWWDAQTPLVRVLPAKPNTYHTYNNWIDRDRVTINGHQEFNIRTGQIRALPNPSEFNCVMGREVYIYEFTPADPIAKSYTLNIIVYTLDWKEVRRWKIPEDYNNVDRYNNLQLLRPYCSEGVVGVFVLSDQDEGNWLVWSDSGLLLQNVSLPRNGFSAPSHSVAFHNTSVMAFVFLPSLYIWNPQTSQLDLAGNSVQYVQWSPDGSWLLVSNNNLLEVWNSNRVVWTVEGITYSDLATSWVDSNWFILAGYPSLLANPALKRKYYLEDMSGTAVVWSPEAKLIMLYEVWLVSPVKFWIPPPPTLELAAGGKVGIPSATTVKLLGVGYFPPTVKTMIRWVDSSTAVAQCLYLNATVVDDYTLSLGNFTLPDPAVYVAHVQYPTIHATSPWVGSESPFAATCPENTLPALNLTGGLTHCECPRNYYTATAALSQLQCKGCPQSGVCDGTAVVLSERDYWPRTEDPYEFLPCAAGACKGDNQCLECHQGPVCGLCEPRCGQHGFGQCRKCNPLWVDVFFLILGLLGWVLLCTIQSLFALGWRNNNSRGNNSAQLAAVIVSTTQFNALLLNVDVKIDTFSKVLGYSEESFQGGGVQSAVVSCILLNTGVDPGNVHFVKQVIMLLLPGIGWVVLLILRVGLRCSGVPTSSNIVKLPTVVMWSSLQAAVTTSLFQTLSCKYVNSQDFQSRLEHDISVRCYGKPYWTFVGVVTIPAILLTVIIIPLRIAWLLRYRQSASDSGHLRFLVKSYRMDWWYLVVFYRKVLLCLIVTFTKNPYDVAVTILASAVMHVIIGPSTAFVVNISETVSLVISAWIFGVAGSIWDDRRGATEFLLVGVFSYCVQLGLLVYDRWHGTGKDEEQVVLEPVEEQSSDNLYTRLN